MLLRPIAVASIAVVAIVSEASATEYTATPSDYRSILTTLVAGDTLRLQAGSYDRGLPIENLAGTGSAPIVITGPETGAPAIIQGRSCCNTISIVDSSYVVIRYLEVDNLGESVDGVKAESTGTSAHHITLEHLDLRGFGNNQQLVGISTKVPAWDWVIRHNTIRQPGTGLYLGNSDGSAPFVRGIIEHNLVVDPIGYGMEIKHQNPRPSLAGMPTGSSVTIVRHNVFFKATNASTGGNARPNLLVGHWPLSGTGQSDRYEIYGNFLYQNASGSEALFQGEGHVAFHDNILVNTHGPGVFIQAHNDVPKEVSLYHNTVYVSGTGILVSGGDLSFQQRVVANAIFSPTPLSISTGSERDNITGGLAMAASYFASPSDVLGTMDFYPKPGMLSGSAVDLSPFSAHLDVNRDFNGDARNGTFRGAYSGEGSNPGWALAEAIKTIGGTMPPADAGVSDAAVRDAGFVDAGASIDASTETDAGPSVDATPSGDAAPVSDAASAPDAGDDGSGNRGTSGGCGCRASLARPQLAPSVVELGAILFAVLMGTRRGG